MLIRLPRFCAQLIAAVGLLSGLGVAAQAVHVDDTPATSSAPQRPRVGLVLAGGGAKGGAHVGVLKVLEEMHVPIDCIAGTSMGALAGGGYASGIPADQMQTFLDGIDWKRVVGGVGTRGLKPIEEKRQGVTYSNQLQLGIQNSQIVFAPGLFNTSAIDDLLRGFVGKAREQADFSRLPIPFRAVATDMVSGRMVVLDHGDLATAMRASMALPGRVCAGHERQRNSCGWRSGEKYSGGCGPQSLRGRRHRREPGIAARRSGRTQGTRVNSSDERWN